MSGFKLYEVLSLDKNASSADIKKAYKRAAMTHHPDKGGDPERFKEIGRAYEILGDDQKRELYNQLGDERYAAHAAGGGPGAGAPFNPFEQMFSGAAGFEHMFGGFGPPVNTNKRGSDHLHTINISLLEAFTGSKRHLNINLTRPCPVCKKECAACQGRGMIQNAVNRGFMMQIMTQKCGICQGQGHTNSGCEACDNKNSTTEVKSIDIDIPRGVENGRKYLFHGLGESGDPPGNLIIQLAVQESDGVFTRSGTHGLVYTVQLDFIESIAGKKIEIPHYSGKIEHTVLGIITPNTVDVIPQKGLTPAGSLEVRYSIKYPPRYIREWSARRTGNLNEILREE